VYKWFYDEKTKKYGFIKPVNQLTSFLQNLTLKYAFGIIKHYDILYILI